MQIWSWSDRLVSYIVTKDEFTIRLRLEMKTLVVRPCTLFIGSEMTHDKWGSRHLVIAVRRSFEHTTEGNQILHFNLRIQVIQFRTMLQVKVTWEHQAQRIVVFHEHRPECDGYVGLAGLNHEHREKWDGPWLLFRVVSAVWEHFQVVWEIKTFNSWVEGYAGLKFNLTLGFGIGRFKIK